MERKTIYKVEITGHLEEPQVVHEWYYQDLENAKQHIKEAVEEDKQTLEVDELEEPPTIKISDDLTYALIDFGDSEFIRYEIKPIYLED